ncbi:hypothetical protein RIF29_23380 [Crotalaria pallida]|uniref:C2H2-type domain-containing protein n=1 Tax=Crotalaria pallida TaxID=3830 RepID=A0AAN9F7J3_CROPI
MEGNYVNSRNTNTTSHHRDHVQEQDHKRFGFEEHTWGTTNSWPARNYGCSFCKREFRSAQALGGHMNVHRRDRARLRSSLPSSTTSSSSWVLSDECPKPNPNPSSSSSSPLSHDELLNNNNNNFTHSSSRQHISPSLCYSPYLTLSSSSTSSGDKKPRLLTSNNNSSHHHQLPLLMSPQSMEIKMSSKSIRSSNAFDVAEELKGFEEEEEGGHQKIFKNSEHNNITLELGIGFLKQEEKLDLELRLGH